MSKLIFALLAATGFASFHANAQASGTPAWACAFTSQIVQDNRFYVIVKGGTVDAYGTMSCTAWNGATQTANVHVSLTQAGIGLGFGFPVDNGTFDMYSLHAGVAAPGDMIGTYQLEAGPGVTLIGEEISVQGGVETGPGGANAFIQISVEQMMGIGVDLTGSTVSITPWQ